jgi:hypothetical protein
MLLGGTAIHMAAANTTAVDSSFLQYGAIGLIAIIALAAVRVLFKRETEAYDRERARADRLEAELMKLNLAIQERYLIALNDATRAVADTLAKLRQG